MASFIMREEYKNGIDIGKDRFLKNARANLTPKGYSKLESLLVDYQVEYIVRCLDKKEIVLLNVEIDSNRVDDFFDVSSILIKSLPHEMIMFLHGNKYGKIYISEGTGQKNKENEKFVKQGATFTFRVGELPDEISALVRSIAATPVSVLTASVVLHDWENIIYKANFLHKRRMGAIIAQEYSYYDEEPLDEEAYYWSRNNEEWF